MYPWLRESSALALDLVLASENVHSLVFAMMYVKRQPTVGRRGLDCEGVCTAGICCGRLVHTLCTHDRKLSAFAVANDFETTFVRVHKVLLHFKRVVLSGFFSRGKAWQPA